MKLVRSALISSTLLLSGIAPAFATPIVHPGDTIGVDVLNYAAVIDDSQGRLKGLDAGSVTVAADGSISIPVAGTLHVAGKTVRQISAMIRDRLDKYVRDPVVSVRLLQQTQQIFLTGATVGTLPYLPGETLSSAIGQLRDQFEKNLGSAMSVSDKNGGTLSRSSIDLRHVVIERDQKQGQPIDVSELLASGRPGPSLEPDDTLILANKPIRVDVRGEVNAPGATYLYPTDTLEQAIIAAGGPNGSASTADSVLLRNGQESPLPLGGAGLRQTPQNGDVIVVHSAPHVNVLGQVPTPGEYTLKNGATLLNALYVAGGPTKWANVRDIQVIHSGARTTLDLTGLTHGDLAPNIPLSDGDVVYVPEGHKIDASLFFEGLVGALGGVYDATHL